MKEEGMGEWYTSGREENCREVSVGKHEVWRSLEKT
jgi:hypothetical protein